MYNPYLYQQLQSPQYQPQYQAPQVQQFQQPQAPPQQSQDDRIWVQNQNAADSYIVAPGSFVRLWDAERPVFYEKRADNSGRPYPLEVYEYSRKKPETAAEPVQDVFAIKTLEERITALESKLSALERGVNDEQHDGDDESI